MYEYMYVNVAVENGFLYDRTGDNYREIIDRAARDGWRYAGNMPMKQSGYGIIKEFDLIFEREVGE